MTGGEVSAVSNRTGKVKRINDIRKESPRNQVSSQNVSHTGSNVARGGAH